MPEQYIITGSITLSDGGDRAGIKVQGFDRDLPSIERRLGTSGKMLGEALTDAEGRFQIPYTLEQFQSGEGILPFLQLKEKFADLSFQVFDRTGQKLRIEHIQALEREYRPEDIIFNAPAQVEVKIFLEPLPETGTSQYEQLIALLAPAMEDVPLSEISDEDVRFLIHELDLDQQGEDRQHIEWLRRCALLAQQTNLPMEAFYGWGSKGLLDLPDPPVKWADVALKDLPTVLKNLIGIRLEKLQEALQTAINDNIIPGSFSTRLDEIIRLLKRRSQVLRSVVAQLQDKETGVPLANYTVTTFDTDTGNENRGLDITDKNGLFSFDFYVSREVSPDAPARNFTFQVVTPGGEALPESEPSAITLTQPESGMVPVKVKVPKSPIPPLSEQLQVAQIQAPDNLVEWFRGKEIYTFADIRRKGGLSQLSDLPPVDPALLRTVEALADLDRVTSNVELSKTLLNRNYDSVLAIADAPYSEFMANMQGERHQENPLELAKLHVMATVQTNLLNNILAGMAANAANGFTLPILIDHQPGENP